MIRFRCVGCGKTLRAKEEQVGRKGKCPRCRTVLEVPTPDSRYSATVEAQEPEGSLDQPKTGENKKSGKTYVLEIVVAVVGTVVGGIVLAYLGFAEKPAQPPESLRQRTAELLQPHEIRRFKGHPHAVLCAAFSPDGRYLISAGVGGIILLWDAQTGEKLGAFLGAESAVGTMAVCRQSRHLATGEDDNGIVRIWDIKSQDQLSKSQVPGASLACLLFDPDGEQLLIGGDRGIGLFNPKSGKMLAHLETDVEKTVTTFSFSGSRQKQEDSSPVTKVKKVRESPSTTAFALAANGQRLLSAYRTDVILWDLPFRREVRRFIGHQGTFIYGVALSPDGHRAVSAGDDLTVRIWDTDSGQQLLRCTGHTDCIDSVAFSPDSKRILSGSIDSTMVLWDVRSGRQLVVYRGHSGPVNQVAFSPDGTLAMSASADGTLRLWTVPK